MSEFIEKEGHILPYKITYKNNKHTYYRVKIGFIDVTTNKRYPKRLITAFLIKNFERFYQALNQQSSERDDEIMLWGKTYELRVVTGNFKYEIKDNLVYLHTRDDVYIAKKRVYLDQLKAMCIKLESEIKPMLNQAHIDLVPLKFRYLKSKFGSYHRKHHEITLNTILAKLDPIYLTYVLYHEYAHTQEFNHSQNFYTVLDRLMPGHRTIQKKLKDVVII